MVEGFDSPDLENIFKVDLIGFHGLDDRCERKCDVKVDFGISMACPSKTYIEIW